MSSGRGKNVKRHVCYGSAWNGKEIYPEVAGRIKEGTFLIPGCSNYLPTLESGLPRKVGVNEIPPKMAL